MKKGSASKLANPGQHPMQRFFGEGTVRQDAISREWFRT